jgi:hypothetical protein
MQATVGVAGSRAYYSHLRATKQYVRARRHATLARLLPAVKQKRELSTSLLQFRITQPRALKRLTHIRIAFIIELVENTLTFTLRQRSMPHWRAAAPGISARAPLDEGSMANPSPLHANLIEFLPELRRIDLRVCEAATRLRAERTQPDREFRGLFVSDAEFEELLARPFGESPVASASRPAEPAVPPCEDRPSRWQRLQRTLGLTPFEADILLLCMLPEVDLKYERIFAYLQDDVTRKDPSVDLALNLLEPDLCRRLLARQVLLPQSPLIHFRLLHLGQADGQPSSLLGETLRVDPRIISYLLGAEDAHAPPDSWMTLERPCAALTDIPLDAETAAQAHALGELSDIAGLWIDLQGKDEWRGAQVARALCTRWHVGLLSLGSEALSGGQDDVCERLALAQREALLQGAALCIHLPINPADDPLRQAERMASWLWRFEDHPYPVFWRTATPQAPTPALFLQRARVATLRIAPPDYGQRLGLWRQALVDAPLDDGAQLPSVAALFRLNGQQIHSAARFARHAAWQRDPAQPRISAQDLYAGARQVSSKGLGELAHHLAPSHTWEDLVLPPDRLAQLHEMCDQYRYRAQVYDAWGFGKRGSRGRGLSALFAGPSGTGKTMAAEVIAHDLELDLYKIDLSGVVSKYIGETEKNLERIFELATDSNAILFFDEADALFGKRSETRDAHDRYANIEISYLLQKIEEYDGVVVLTTNLRQNLDEAFMRRLTFSIEFPFPDEEARLRIWRQLTPADAPLALDVDLDALAVRFKFSGGSIRNVLVTAAFLAARDGQEIRMSHLLWASRREFQKLGRLVEEGQFAPSLHR